MSSTLLRKYLDIISESEHKTAQHVDEVSPPGWGKSVEKMKKHKDIDNPFALAWYMHNKGYKPHHKESAGEDQIDEKWDKDTAVDPQERGKYNGRTKDELLKSYNALKSSGPHPRGSPEFGRMRELAFAIRAKGGWGKVE